MEAETESDTEVKTARETERQRGEGETEKQTVRRRVPFVEPCTGSATTDHLCSSCVHLWIHFSNHHGVTVFRCSECQFGQWVALGAGFLPPWLPFSKHILTLWHRPTSRPLCPLPADLSLLLRGSLCSSLHVPVPRVRLVVAALSDRFRRTSVYCAHATPYGHASVSICLCLSIMH